MGNILLYALVAIGYFGLAGLGWFATAHIARVPADLAMAPGASASVRETGYPSWERGGLALVWIAHFFLMRSDFLHDGVAHFGFGLALSATLWLGVAVFWVESLYYALAAMRLFILPLAGLCALLTLWFPGNTTLSSSALTQSFAFEAHLVVALAAYGLLTIAALQALLMAALDRWLHSAETAPGGQAGALAQFETALLRPLPPLLTMERLLFRLVSLGFVLLTLTVLTGVVFSETLFNEPMRLDEKTVFTLIAWLIFGALLAGRWRYGWRGRVALRWTLAGFLALLLGYAGSRFVLEVILQRG
jgi:ABC-type uncharacterized transport system permease subunit